MAYRYDPETPDIETPLECQVDPECPDIEQLPDEVLREYRRQVRERKRDRGVL